MVYTKQQGVNLARPRRRRLVGERRRCRSQRFSSIANPPSPGLKKSKQCFTRTTSEKKQYNEREGVQQRREIGRAHV